jgi:hypothetical protein
MVHLYNGAASRTSSLLSRTASVYFHNSLFTRHSPYQLLLARIIAFLNRCRSQLDEEVKETMLLTMTEVSEKAHRRAVAWPLAKISHGRMELH